MEQIDREMLALHDAAALRTQIDHYSEFVAHGVKKESLADAVVLLEKLAFTFMMKYYHAGAEDALEKILAKQQQR